MNIVENYLNNYCIDIMWSNGKVKDSAEVCDVNRFKGSSMQILSKFQSSKITPKDFYLYVISRYKKDPTPVEIKGKHYKVNNTMYGTDSFLKDADTLWKIATDTVRKIDDWYEKRA